jgi:hypothetical protein
MIAIPRVTSPSSCITRKFAHACNVCNCVCTHTVLYTAVSGY